MRPRGTPPRLDYDESPCPNPDLRGPCHVFRYGKSTKGYGVVWLNGRQALAHRHAWERYRGPIPEGMEIDHQCRTRACVNPDHLRVVTKAVNLTENVVGSCWKLLAAKTHCLRGHVYDEVNTYRDKHGRRGCRACNRLRAAKRRKETANASL